MNNFSVWIIDPYVKTVGIVELSKNHGLALSDMYRLIGCSMVDAGCYHGLIGDDMLYFDEEALLKNGSPIPSFRIDGWKILGRALVIGMDNSGNGCSPETSVISLVGMVKWL